MDILTPRRQPRFGMVEGVVLGIYSILVAWLTAHHEPWTDEAQAWLLARDLSLSSLFLKHLHYEGTPGLWHLFLWILSRLHISYGLMHWITAGVAVTGMWIFLAFSPFPAILRATVPFTCFIVYQYAVIARSYALIPIFVFCIAALFSKPIDNLIALSLLLGLLGNISAHGFILSLGFGLILSIRLWQYKRTHEVAFGTQRLTISIVIVCSLWVFAVVSAWPAADNSYNPPSKLWHLNDLIFRMMPVGFSRLWPVSLFIGTSLLAYLFARRRPWEIAPCALLQLFFALVVVRPWHIGIMFIAAVGVVWVNWPTDEEKWRSWDRSLTIVLLVAVIDQITVSAHDIAIDIKYPYSGDQQAATFLRDKISKKHVDGVGYYSIGILPYFQSNIYENQQRYSFWSWNKASENSDQISNVSQILQEHPDYLVVGFAWVDPSDQQSASKFLWQITQTAFPLQKQIETRFLYRETHRFCGIGISGFTYREGLCLAIFEPIRTARSSN